MPSSMFSIFAVVIVEMFVVVLSMLTAVKSPMNRVNRHNNQPCKSVLNPYKSPWRNMSMFKLGGAPHFSIDYRWTYYSNICERKRKRKGAINIVRTWFSSKMFNLLILVILD
eukprot:907123_1